jgi:hypothetical protein
MQTLNWDALNIQKHNLVGPEFLGGGAQKYGFWVAGSESTWFIWLHILFSQKMLVNN